MQNQNKTLQLRQDLTRVHIHQDRHGHHAPVHQSALPQSGLVGCMVETGESDDHVAAEVCATGEDGLPAADYEPACEIVITDISKVVRPSELGRQKEKIEYSGDMVHSPTR